MTIDAEAVFGLVVGLPLLGLIVIRECPFSWQNVWGWLGVSYVGIQLGLPP